MTLHIDIQRNQDLNIQISCSYLQVEAIWVRHLE